jgi:hypothetical protein
MKAIKSMLTVLMLVIGALPILGASVDSNLWDLGSSNDWLSTGPVNHTGPFFYPNSDLDLGTQRFLNTYPSYIPIGYPNYYPTNKPVVLGNYTPAINYLQGYNYPYYAQDPQAALDYSVANHQYQKYLNNYYNRYYWNYGT